MNPRIFSLGAAGEVTGSKHFLDTGDSLVMMDCGAFQGKRNESDSKNREWNFDAKDLDAVVLSHAHFDHSGLVPLLHKKGYRGNIYSTPATRDLASLIMMDSAKIQARDAEFLAKEARKDGREFGWKPLYDEKDVVGASNLFVTMGYERPMFVTRDVTATFYDAGHILGSAITRFEISCSGGRIVRLGYSGDLGRKNKPIIRDPQAIPPVDYLILESTYGDRLHEETSDAMEKLADVVRRTAARGGKVIIPAFAIERTQELVFFLHLLTDAGKIPKLPIYVDSPMATNATGIFKIHPECYDEETNKAFVEHHENPFGFNELRYTESTQASKDLNGMKGSMIIVSASGMCEAGRVQHHLINNLADKKNTILLVGYMAAHTVGRKIKDRMPEVRILGKTIPVEAEVEEINAFSAHADYQETWDYLQQLKLDELKGIYLVHGEPDAQSHLRKFLLEKGIPRVDIVEKGEKYDLA